MNAQPDQPPTGRALYERVSEDVGRGMAYVPFFLGGFWLIARIWPGAGRVLFWIAAAVVAFSLLHFLFVVLAGVLGGVLGVAMRAGGTTRWHWGAVVIRLIEQLWDLGALWLAAYIVGYWPLSNR